MITVGPTEPQEEDDPLTSQADLVRIGSWRYVFFRNENGDFNGEQGAHSTAHTLPMYRMKRTWNALKVSYVNADELSRRMEKGKAPFFHENQAMITRVTEDGQRIVVPRTVTVHAPASEIRAYLEQHEDDEVLFPTFVLKRER